MKTINEILSEREMFSVEENHTVADVVREMAARRIGAILVLGGGKLRGIFSERDLMTRVVVDGLDTASTRVSDVMTSNLATIEGDASIEDAMNLMQQIGCRHLPVLRQDTVLGMVSMRDLMKLELDQKTEEIHHMRSYIQGG
jgi:CBS domain-containing protein